MQELRKTDPAAFEKAQTEARRLAADYKRDYAQFDDETIAAVDKFRAGQDLNYQGNPPGLVDERLVTRCGRRISRRRSQSPSPWPR